MRKSTLGRGHSKCEDSCRRNLVVSGNRRKCEMISDEKLDHVGPVEQMEESRCYYKCRVILWGGGFKLGNNIILIFVFKRAPVCSVKDRCRGRSRSRED